MNINVPLLKAVSMAAALNDVRVSLNTVLFEVKDKRLICVASNGVVMLVGLMGEIDSQDMCITVPIDVIQNVVRHKVVQWDLDSHKFVATGVTLEYTPDTVYPDWRRVVPRDPGEVTDGIELKMVDAEILVKAAKALNKHSTYRIKAGSPHAVFFSQPELFGLVSAISKSRANHTLPDGI